MNEGPLEALRAFGASERVIEQWRKALQAQAKADGIEVWPEHWHALEVFLSLARRWQVVGGWGGLTYIGLDAAGIELALREHAGTPHEQPLAVLMPQLRVMEGAALPLLNERH